MISKESVAIMIDKLNEKFPSLFLLNPKFFYSEITDKNMGMITYCQYDYSHPEIYIDIKKYDNEETICKSLIHELLHSLRPEEDVKLTMCTNKKAYRMLEERMTCRMTDVLFELLDIKQFVKTLEEK